MLANGEGGSNLATFLVGAASRSALFRHREGERIYGHRGLAGGQQCAMGNRKSEVRNPSPSGTGQQYRYIVGCPKQPGLYCGRPRQETGWWAFVRVFGDTPFLRISILPIDPHCNEDGDASCGLLEDWVFAPVNLPKASPLQEQEKLEPWLDQLGRARESVLAVANDLALPGYLRPELAEIAVGLNAARLKLEQMYRPAWGPYAAELDRRIRNGALGRASKSKSTITSKKGGRL